MRITIANQSEPISMVPQVSYVRTNRYSLKTKRESNFLVLQLED